MQKKEFKDAMSRPLGTIISRSSGVLEARDTLGRPKGTYDPRSNETRDTLGRLLGKGDMLPGLITKK